MKQPKRNQKVLYCSITDQLGGAEQVLKMIARNQPETENHVFMLRGPYTGTWDDVTGITIHSPSGKGLLRSFWHLMAFVRKHPKWHRIYTTHIALTFLFGIMIRRKFLRKNEFIARESTVIFQRFKGIKLRKYRWMYRWGYTAVDLLICQTDFMKQQFTDNIPWLARQLNIQTICNPVDTNYIHKLASGTPSHLFPTPYVITAGRFIPEKGFDVLLHAFKKLIQCYPELTLIIFGEGEQRDNLSAIIKNLGLNDKVFLPGYEKNIYPYLRKAELCVISSRKEGFPNVLLQMMALNTKVVSTRCAGGIQDLPGLFTCNTEDVQNLCQAMALCLDSDTQYCRKLFDEELEKRSVCRFLGQIDQHLNE